jgi:excisionase family DNA binding protein
MYDTLIMEANMKEALVDAKQAAEILGITRGRIIQLINAKRLRAVKLGGRWLINIADLESVRGRPTGRPRKNILE